MFLFEESGTYTLLLAYIGILSVFLILLDTIWVFIQAARSALAPYLLSNEEESLVKRFGEWALVTGCTDGIGKAYSKELAKKGHSIVLVSRSEEKLKATAKEIESEYAVKTKIIVADFSNGKAAIEHIRQEVGKLPIGILVNNVGVNYAYPMYVGEVPEDVLWDIINVNIGAVTLMTRMIIKDMQERGRGAIVNVSSGSELQPLPLMAVYAASKVYIKSFTQALRYEYSRYNITIQHLSPLFINTKMNKFSDRLQTSSLLVPDVQSYAKYACNTLGKLDHTTGYWSHGIQYFITRLSPDWLRMYFGGRMNKIFRNEYLKNNSKKIS